MPLQAGSEYKPGPGGRRRRGDNSDAVETPVEAAPAPPPPPPPPLDKTPNTEDPNAFSKKKTPIAAPTGGGGGGAGTVEGGGGGGGGGGQSLMTATAANADWEPGSAADQMIKQNIFDRISGKISRFSPEIVEQMKGTLMAATNAQVGRAKEGIYSDAARRGIFRSAVTSGSISRAENAGIAAYSAGVKDILMQKAFADYDDKVKALDAAQNWIQSARQYYLGKKQIEATLEAAAMQAAASRYAADQGLKGAMAAAGASKYAANKAYQAHQDSLVNVQDTVYAGYSNNGFMTPAAVAAVNTILNGGG